MEQELALDKLNEQFLLKDNILNFFDLSTFETTEHNSKKRKVKHVKYYPKPTSAIIS